MFEIFFNTQRNPQHKNIKFTFPLLQGVHSLIQQQNKLLGDIRERLGSQEEEKKMEAPYLSMHQNSNAKAVLNHV